MLMVICNPPRNLIQADLDTETVDQLLDYFNDTFYEAYHAEASVAEMESSIRSHFAKPEEYLSKQRCDEQLWAGWA